jgi:tetraprenyl-beta-curcumene synthase
MAGMKSLRIPNLQDAFSLLAAGVTHWLEIAPRARGELHHWRRHARSAPDPTLRKLALEKLWSEALNPEAAAFFAILAPRKNRRGLIRLIVAYQAMYDYLDAVNEPTAAAPLRNGLQLHRILAHTVRPPAGPVDYYAHNPQHDDGGYLEALKGACRDILKSLPSIATVNQPLYNAAERCGEAQARNHAITVEGRDQMMHWSREQAPRSGYLWWELAAAGISCLAIHALFAAAATPRMTPREAQLIDAAYFPPVCAISALLDSLIDLPLDAGTTNHSFAAHYRSSGLVAERYATIIDSAGEMLSKLHLGRRHKIILAGITGYYLSAPEAATDFARPATARAIDVSRPMIRPILALMRIRRRGHSAASPEPTSRCHVASE